MGCAILGAAGWNGPGVIRKLGPCHAGNLLAALAGQHEKADDAIEWPWAVRRTPDRGKLVVG
jgi:hypothetical protein